MSCGSEGVLEIRAPLQGSNFGGASLIPGRCPGLP